MLAENHTENYVQIVFWLNRIVLSGQLPGDLNMLQRIQMDPQATLSIHVGPPPG